YFFFSSRRRHTRSYGDWSSDVCSSDLLQLLGRLLGDRALLGGLEAFFLDIPHQDPASRHLIGGDLAERRFRVDLAPVDHEGASRSEERRVGKEWRRRMGGCEWREEVG